MFESQELLQPSGEAPKAGEIFANPALANTLETVANFGKDGFYKGSYTPCCHLSISSPCCLAAATPCIAGREDC